MSFDFRYEILVLETNGKLRYDKPSKQAYKKLNIALRYLKQHR